MNVIDKFSNQELFFHAFHKAAIGMALVSIEGKLLKVNQSLINILGYNKQVLLTLDFQTITHPADLEKDLNFLNQLLNDEIDNYDMEKRYFHSDGSIVWALLSVSLIRDEKGNPLFFISQIQDITNKKFSEAELVKKVKELKDIKYAMDASSIIAVTDSKGVITYVNDKFCEISKYERAELEGNTHKLINSGHHPSSFFKTLWCTLREGNTWKGEIKNKAKDGSFYWVYTVIVPFLDSIEEKPYQYVSIRTDITKRKLVEQFLLESKHKLEIASSELKAIIENLPFGMMMESQDRKVKLVNKEFCSLFKIPMTPDEMQGMDCKELLIQAKGIFKMSETFMSRVEEILLERKVIYNEELELKDTRVLERDYIPVFSNEKYIGHLWNYRDITERKESERKIKRANQMLEQISRLDGLTEISNRRSFDDKLSKEWKEALTNSRDLSIVMIDIDYFKKYNDSYGHQGGDECLKKVAKCIDEFCQDNQSFAARYGGEEFSIILSGYSEHQATSFGENLCLTIRNMKLPHKSSEISNFVTVSVGIASIVPDGMMVSSELVEMADRALYEAKENGRNQAFIFKANGKQ